MQITVPIFSFWLYSDSGGVFFKGLPLFLTLGLFPVGVCSPSKERKEISGDSKAVQLPRGLLGVCGIESKPKRKDPPPREEHSYSVSFCF